MFITPFLTEVLTTNVSITMMLRPRILLAMMTIGYGFAVLVLREIAVRMRAGVISMVLMGLIYGMYNEGLIAKTLFRVHGVPINTFDGYGFFGGFETAWAIAISTWHAFFAFLFPIVIVYSLYPGEREERWLNRTALAILAVVTVVISALAFFGKGNNGAGIRGTPAQYLIMAALSAVLFFIAKRCSKTGRITALESHSFLPAVFLPAIHGFCAYLAIILVPALLAAARIPILLYLAYFAALGWYFFRGVSRKGEISLDGLRIFAFGGQVAVALFALLMASKRHSVESIASSSIFIVGLGYLLFRQTRIRVHPSQLAPPITKS
jgi:hypothetical protein